MSFRGVRDAVVTELEKSLPGLVFTSYSAPAGMNKYAVVFTALTGKPRTRFAGGQWRDVFTVTVHSVGVTEEHALWVAERVNALTDKRLAVTGRSLFPVEYGTGRPPTLDDDGPAPLWFTVSQFDIISDPA